MAEESAAFGSVLRELRLAASLTLEGLAEVSGVSVRGIGDLERGRRAAPQRRTVAALADGLCLAEPERERLLAAARAGRSPGYSPAGVRAFPRGIDDFVGRERELGRLRELAEGTHVARRSAARGVEGGPEVGVVVAAVSGPPGTGKTSLVLHAARELADLFPDGQLLVDLRGMDDVPPEPVELMLGVLKALGVADRDLAKAGPQGHPGLYRQVLADRRCLLVLDNARDEAQARPLLPGSGTGMVLVTSRRMLTGLESVHRLPLGELSADEAAVFLTGLVGEERAAADPAALAEVAERCGHLPLALRVAGNWLATRTGWSVRRLADRLAFEERRLDALTAGDLRVSAAFDLSYRQLTPTAALLFRRLALVEGPDVGAACAARLTGQQLFDAEDTLEELVETGLLGTDGDRYRFHDLLRLYARASLAAEESTEDTERARAAMHHWLLETAVVAGRWYEPGHGAPPATWQGTVDLSTAEKARRWLQAEGANWLAALHRAASAEEHAVVVEVAEALHWFSDQWIYWGHWPEVFGTAARSAQELGDPLVEATQLNYHAWALLLCEGRHHDSIARAAQALTAAERAGDTVQQAWAHFYTAWALRWLGDYTPAAEHNQRAARLFQDAGDMHGTVQAMSGHGSVLVEAGRAEEAIAANLRVLAFLDAAGDRLEPHIALFTRFSRHHGNGRAYALLKRWDEAVEHLRSALELSHDSGNTGLESRCLVDLGQVLLDAGRAAEGQDAFTRCLALGAGADPRAVTEARDQLTGRAT
ncbi:tetratricopeptide repeat protein [Streptomyces sp. AC555_RSS877]|uniref:ATP-binding protein n=1 Tax=Streptomyces sp. AC555_RSS877 TaxID=2823688 RepID=UPI001C269CFE|nr:XRE family transcriptional regulator [Streptomyces sp. AC555_RSS877]